MSDKDGTEADNKDEAIVPTDMNLICDDDLRLILSRMAQARPPLRLWHCSSATRPQPCACFGMQPMFLGGSSGAMCCQVGRESLF